jgi:chaperonin GroES
MFDHFKPAGNRILVKIIEQETKTSGGIYMPGSVEQEVKTGSVLQVGPGRKNEEGKHVPMDVNVGDTVFFGRYAGTKADEHYLLLREDELLGSIS